MIACKRTLLILLYITTLIFTGYQIFLIIKPLYTFDIETRYVYLVDQYRVLKMQRLVLEEKYALLQARKKVTDLSGQPSIRGNEITLTANSNNIRGQLLPHSAPLNLGRPPVAEEPVALSLAETKTFEQLEAYVSNNKPTSLQPLSKDEKFILQSPADSFTLQLMGVRDSSELTRFVSEHQLLDAHIIHTYYLNKDWYVLVSGSYKNHTEALKAIDTLPQMIKDHKPWIRQVASLQKAIQLYRN